MFGNDKMFPVLPQGFFLKRMIDQKGASPETIKSYRDALLLGIKVLGYGKSLRNKTKSVN